MKKAVLFGNRKAGIVDAPDLEPREDWVVIKVHASAMCTEYKLFLAGQEERSIGHEAAGEVAAVAQPCNVEVGDRVVVLPCFTSCGKCELCVSGDFTYCENRLDYNEYMKTAEGPGAFAQYVARPSRSLFRIPDSVPYEKAVMAIDGIGASFSAIQRIGVSAFDTVLITGLGPIGLGSIINCRFRGSRVIGVEPVAWRRERATQIGAETVLDPTEGRTLDNIMELTDRRGVDYALDCSGTAQGERLCIDAVRRRGKVAFIGECNQDLGVRVSPDFIRKGLTVIGTWCSSMGDQAHIMRVIEESPLVDLLVSHVMPMSRIQDAFELLAKGECAKVVLDPWK